MIIPKPQKIDYYDGKFILNNNTVIYSPIESNFIVKPFVEILKTKYKLDLKVVTETREKNIIILESDFDLKDENADDYSIDISSERIKLMGLSIRGLFYAFQSLRQLIIEEENNLIIPAQKIFDYPRFSYRGFMFDVGRHYHPIETIKKVIDVLALLKMNVFHWHLTEDQGWRIEIKKYPKLTEIGSKRKDTKIGGHKSKKYRGKPHEGFYTQEEIRDIVKYAEERFIEVIPEIELPGHCTAAIASYPELSCTGE
ncbi:MAG: beta-N-acetylhexosaminidase, partial [Candidatus Heimdallarchaeota archaeon]